MSAPMQNSRLLCLPNEMLAQIIQSINSLEDLQTLPMVCAQLNGLILTPSMLKSLFVKPKANIKSEYSYSLRKFIYNHYDDLKEGYQVAHPLHQTIQELYARNQVIDTLVEGVCSDEGSHVFLENAKTAAMKVDNFIEREVVIKSMPEVQKMLYHLLDALTQEIENVTSDVVNIRKQHIRSLVDKVKAEYLFGKIKYYNCLVAEEDKLSARKEMKAITLSSGLYQTILQNRPVCFEQFLSMLIKADQSVAQHIVWQPDFMQNINYSVVNSIATHNSDQVKIVTLSQESDSTTYFIFVLRNKNQSIEKMFNHINEIYQSFNHCRLVKKQGYQAPNTLFLELFKRYPTYPASVDAGKKFPAVIRYIKTLPSFHFNRLCEKSYMKQLANGQVTIADMLSADPLKPVTDETSYPPSGVSLGLTNT